MQDFHGLAENLLYINRIRKTKSKLLIIQTDPKKEKTIEWVLSLKVYNLCNKTQHVSVIKYILPFITHNSIIVLI